MTFCHYYQLQQRSGSGSDLLPDHFFEWDRDRDLDRFLGKDRDRDLVRFFRDRSIACYSIDTQFFTEEKIRFIKNSHESSENSSGHLAAGLRNYFGIRAKEKKSCKSLVEVILLLVGGHKLFSVHS